MKTLSLFVIFLLMISCNTSTKQVSKPVLEQTETSPNIVTEKKVQEVVIKDTIAKEELTTSSLEKKEPKEKVAPIVSKKEVVSKAIPETKNQKVVIEEEVITEKIIPTSEKKQEPIRPSHNAWDKLTKTYVSSNGKVNYTGLKSQITTINSYLLHLQNTPPTKDWSKNEKLAYWFNLYNASTVYLIATNYPVKSIKDINAGKPWDKKFIKSGSKIYSLNDIENTVVRPNYNEPRLHVAFNCAAVSCPNLLNGAFSPTKLNVQLNALSKKWLNDISKNNITTDKIEISQIFNWYKTDFKEGVIPFINKYTNVKVNPDAKVDYKDYNWNLNE